MNTNMRIRPFSHPGTGFLDLFFQSVGTVPHDALYHSISPNILKSSVFPHPLIKTDLKVDRTFN